MEITTFPISKRRALAARVSILLVAIVTLPQGTASPQNPLESSDDIEYFRDIAPIFAQYCHECHGPDRAENDFRLDSPTYLREDIESPFPLLSDTLETNEIFQRVISGDTEARMPWRQAPLSEEEIEKIRRWIEQGLPLGIEPETDPLRSAAREADGASTILDQVNRWFYDRPSWTLLLCLLLAANAAFLWIERRKRHLKTTDSSESRHPMLLRIGAIHYLYIWTAFAMTFGVLYLNDQVAQEREQRITAEAHAKEIEAKIAILRPLSNVEAHYGNPPTPVRMNHSNALEREYYRGNDERSPHLFNGGYYRTSTIQVRLVHANEVPYQVGDEIREGDAFVEFVFDRAPYTVAALYSDTVMRRTSMSSQYPWNQSADKPARAAIEVVEPGHKWRLRYPVAIDGAAPDSIRGLVYVYYRGSVHYGVTYDLLIKDGRVLDGSDVWLGNLFVSTRLLPHPPANYITQREWLDYSPIPIITEKPTVTDPDLLGATEHLGSDADLN